MVSTCGNEPAWSALLADPPHLPWWQVLTIAVVGAAARLALRYLAERTRRQTLEMLVTSAPSGTVVHQSKGPGGPAMTVWTGTAVTC